MYVTKRLSDLKKFPTDLNLSPPEGPYSGILVVEDEEEAPTPCLGLCKSDSHRVWSLPFPQNKKLELSYASGFHPNRILHFHNVAFFPVLNQPPSSKLYYAVHPFGKDRGKAFTSSKEEDITTCCCFFNYNDDEQPIPLDPHDKFHQFEIHRYLTGFVAKSVAPNGHPPKLLSKRGWRLDATSSPEFRLGEALGLDTSLRSHLPEFDFPLNSNISKPIMVGKWYCPFMFVKEGTPKTQQDWKTISMFYEMTLEQRWEMIFECESENRSEDKVLVNIDVEREVVEVGGREGKIDERDLESDGVLWFRSVSNFGEETRVGLRREIVERMKWEEEKVGWISGRERKVRVTREENSCGWRRFGCFMLVERFVLKRMDGGLVLSYEFNHTHQIRTKLEF